MNGIPSCPNLRDLGGIELDTGYVREGRLVRSGALWRLGPEDIEMLGRVAAVYDMRSENERSYRPNPAIPGAEYIHIPITENGRRKLTQSKRTLQSKVEDILEGYRRGEPTAAERMCHVYRGMVLSAHTGRCVGGIIQAVLEDRGPVIYHCSAGKDRAGVVTALLLRLLGAEDGAVYKDYLYTNIALAHELREAEKMAMAITGSRQAADYVLGFFAACPCWLGAALDTLEGSFASIEDYTLKMAGVTMAQIQAFKSLCIIKSP